MTPPLFDPDHLPQPPTPAQAAQSMPAGKPRLRVPQRDQIEFHWASLDQLLDPDHPVRIIWAAVCALDLSAWLKEIKAVEGHVGRDATDPRLLVALWVYATIKGISSARELDELCGPQGYLPFRWLCGGVSVNYGMLARFRSQGGEKWDDQLTHIVGTLVHAGLVTMERIAQDGVRVRANASTSSFHRRGSLEESLKEAQEQVETLKELAQCEESEAEAEGKQPQRTRAKRGARERAADERQKRIDEAMRQCEELQRQREASAKQSGRKVQEARASTTDPEARTMKMPDGGTRPAYNVQFATDTASGVVIGVEVSNEGTDGDQLPGMLDQAKERYDHVPSEALVDGGFATKDTVEGADTRNCTVYAPLKNEKKQKEAGEDPYAPKPKDSAAVADWRKRMGTEEAKEIYKLRGQTAEWVNAQCRNRGLWQMPVRGQPRCRIIALLHAITHNLIVGVRLCADATKKVALA
jgi:transposase